jgi:AAA domain/Protein of unknown function (DUF1275)
MIALLAELLLVLVAGVVAVGLPVDAGGGRRYVVIGLLAAGLGLQNATVRRLAVPDVTTIVLTLTLTGLAADSWLAGGHSPRIGRRLARAGRADLDERTVLLVDEAGMIGTRKLLPLLEHAKRAHAKVVLIGDDKQLQFIDAGGGFRALANRLGAYELTVNRRQRDPLDQEAVELCLTSCSAILGRPARRVC